VLAVFCAPKNGKGFVEEGDEVDSCPDFVAKDEATLAMRLFDAVLGTGDCCCGGTVCDRC